MSQSSLDDTQRFRGKLRRTTLLVLLPLAMIPLLLLGLLTLRNTNSFLHDQIASQFENVAVSQSSQIEMLINSKTEFLNTLLSDTLFITGLNNALSIKASSSFFDQIKQWVLDDYTRISQAQNIKPFDHFLIVLPDNYIYSIGIENELVSKEMLERQEPDFTCKSCR